MSDTYADRQSHDSALVKGLTSTKMTNSQAHCNAVQLVVSRLHTYNGQVLQMQDAMEKKDVDHHRRLREQRQVDAMKAEKEKDVLRQAIDKLWEFDLLLEADDGKRIPCCKEVLCNASAHFRSLLSAEMADAGVAEATEGVVRLEASSATVRLLAKSLHLPSADTRQVHEAASVQDELDLVKLAAMYSMSELFDSAFGHLLRKPASVNDVAGWYDAVATSQLHLDAHDVLETSVSCWRQLQDAALRCIAQLLPASAQNPAFGSLSLATLEQLFKRAANHALRDDLPTGIHAPPEAAALDGPTFRYALSALELRVDDPAYKAYLDAACEVPAIASETTLTLPSGATESLTLSLVRSTVGLGSLPRYYVKLEGAAAGNEVSILCSREGTDQILHPSQSMLGHFRIPEQCLSIPPTDGSFRIRGFVHLVPSLRKLELVRLWLQSSGRTAEVLSPIVTLQFLNATRHGVDVASMPPDEVEAALEARRCVSASVTISYRHQIYNRSPVGLQLHSCRAMIDTSNFDLPAKRTALLDQLSCEPPVEKHTETFAEAVASYAARTFADVAESEEFLELDARSLSLVLRYFACSETAMMHAVVRWALRPGREISVVDRVLPLVRFPQCTDAITPTMDAGLSTLWARCKASGSTVLTKLLKEAIEFHTGKRKHGDVDRHRTFHRDSENVPRDKKRRLSTCDDKVGSFDPLSHLERCAGLR